MMRTRPIPESAIDKTTGSGVKSRVSDPKNRAQSRPCAACGCLFAPHRKRNEAKYCSKKCVWIVERGPEFNARVARESASLRGDMLRGRGEGKTYRKLDGRRHEHRVIAEQNLGRPLAPGEIVHHDDETKINNGPDNLIVLASQSEHARLHFTGKKQSPEQIQRRVAARLRTIYARKSA